MSKLWKKAAAALLAAMMVVVSLSACGGEGESSSAAESSESQVSSASSAAEEESEPSETGSGSEEEIVTLKVWGFQNAAPDTNEFNKVADAINELTRDSIGVEVELFRSFDYETLNLALTSGEKLDLLQVHAYIHPAWLLWCPPAMYNPWMTCWRSMARISWILFRKAI